MNTKRLLDQLLRSGQSMLDDKRARGPSHGHGATGGKGALATGALGLLLGGRRSRSFGGKATKYGGLAALGMLAYRAYDDWQRKSGTGATGQPRTVDRVPEAEAESHSRAILKALVGAAKADGHIDERERELIDAEIAKLDDDPEVQAWLDAELRRSLDPAEVASAATSAEMASEMYLASVLMVDEQSYMERAYLDELSRQLRLDPTLRRQLEQEASAA
ncbi:MAG: tellurite resistance TerB family protein [Nitrococcus sp.]|nr:tellurite resistance TerB family protein [Nitrococcus sp.]